MPECAQARSQFEDFTEGDRVTGLGITTEQGNGMPTIIGYSNQYHGAFGEFIVVDAFWVRHVPDGLSLEHAALASRSTSARCTCSSPV